MLVKNKAFVKDAQAAIDSLYDLNDKASEKILQPWREKYPRDPLWIFWKGMEAWWKILPDLSNTEYDKQAIYYFSKADYEASQILSSGNQDLDALIIKSASNAFLARIYANREDWLKAFQRGQDAYDALKQVQSVDPSLPDIKFGLGIYNYYSAWIPEEYPFLKHFSWILPRGNKTKGLHMLQVAADSSVFVQPEALYFLADVYLKGEHDEPRAITYLDKLEKKFPKNSYYKRLLVETYYTSHDYMTAMGLIQRYLKQADEKSDQDPYKYALREELYTIKGLIFFQYDESHSAIEAFTKAQSISLKSPGGKTRSFYLMSGYYLGTIYKSLNDDKKARQYFKEVSRQPTDSKYVKLARGALDSLHH